MKYVLDASVALKWVLIEQDTPKATDLRNFFKQQVQQLLAPETFLIEVAHALTRAERRCSIKVGEASILLGDVLSTRPDLHRFFPLLPRAMELSSQFRIGVYDCLYVALAEREGCDLITADEKLVKALPESPIIFLSSL